MAKIDVYDAVYEGYSKIAEKIDFIGREIYDHLELADFKNYLLGETEKVKRMSLDYQSVFGETYNPGFSKRKEGYGDVFDGYNRIKEAMARIQDEIDANVDHGDFKKYILDEISRLQVLLLDYQRVFVEGYCFDEIERKTTSEQIQQKIDAINAELERSGLSL